MKNMSSVCIIVGPPLEELFGKDYFFLLFIGDKKANQHSHIYLCVFRTENRNYTGPQKMDKT